MINKNEKSLLYKCLLCNKFYASHLVFGIIIIIFIKMNTIVIYKIINLIQ